MRLDDERFNVVPTPKCVNCGHAESNHYGDTSIRGRKNSDCKYCNCDGFVLPTEGSNLVVLNFSRQTAMEMARHKVLEEFKAFCDDIGMFRYVEANENTLGPNGGTSDQIIGVVNYEGHYLPIVMQIYCDNAVDKRVNQMLAAKENETKANERLKKFVGEE